MDAYWNLYRFDYSRFVMLLPSVRSALDPTAFASLSDSQETDAIVEALVEGDIEVVPARHDLVISLCCIGEPLPCPRQFLKILQKMRSNPRSEAGMDILADAFAAGRNLEAALRPPGRLAGLLTPAETADVYASYWKGGARGLPQRRPRIRRGGLVGAIGGFFRRLFDRGLAEDELRRLLGDLLEEAVENGEGMAVVLA
ncbi:MAG TPA: hypothetical protein VKT77_21300 [Chthonomonadaceae bacterium]|nr:hypothetical protein [Chthonomonadaceae bacterium]